jgi:hypothetical protein
VLLPAGLLVRLADTITVVGSRGEGVWVGCAADRRGGGSAVKYRNGSDVPRIGVTFDGLLPRVLLPLIDRRLIERLGFKSPRRLSTL